MMKVKEEACQLKDNNWRNLLAVVIFDFWNENPMFRKLASATMSLIPSQFFKAFLMKLVVILIYAIFG